MHDLKLLRAQGGEGFVGQPTSLFPGSTYRSVRTVLIVMINISRTNLSVNQRPELPLLVDIEVVIITC